MNEPVCTKQGPNGCVFKSATGKCLKPKRLVPTTEDGDYGALIVGNTMMTLGGPKPITYIDLGVCRYQQGNEPSPKTEHIEPPVTIIQPARLPRWTRFRQGVRK